MRASRSDARQHSQTNLRQTPWPGYPASGLRIAQEAASQRGKKATLRLLEPRDRDTHRLAQWINSVSFASLASISINCQVPLRIQERHACPALPCFRARPPGSNSPSHAPNRRRTSTERHPPAQPYDDDDAAARAAAIARYPIGKAFRRDGGPPCPPFFAGFGTAAPSPLAESSRWERARATPAARRQLCACREPSETEEAVFHECALQRACLPVRLFALCDAMGHG